MIFVGEFHVRRCWEDRGIGQVVAGKVGQQGAHVIQAVALVGGHVVGDTRCAVVGAGSAEILERNILAGHGLDDVGAGDEHV